MSFSMRHLPLALPILGIASLLSVPAAAQTASPLSPSPAAVALASVTHAAPHQTAETVDASVMARIREEGLNHSQVTQTLSYLTDVIGPRLTASRQLKHANNWTKDKLTEWGLQNAHLEAWGPFGLGWELTRFSAQVVEPMDIPLIALPRAWSPSIKGTLTTDVVYLDVKSEADFAKYKGTLKDKIVLVSPMSDVKAHFDPEGHRFTDKDLTEMAAPPPPPGPGGRPDRGGRPPLTPEQQAAFRLNALKLPFVLNEGAALAVYAARGDGGTVFVQQVVLPNAPPPLSRGREIPPAGSTPPANPPRPWKEPLPRNLPQVALASEQYNRLVRMLQAGEKVRIAVELQAKFTDIDKGMAFNTVAEIPGSDKKDEIVMCGGHMDSWQGGTGATDNGAGVAVAMEAVRILKALNLQPRRTIRVALWSGEEQGLFGSTAYVAQHFGTLAKPSAENGQVSAYYNLDNGTGKIRGVYCQGNGAVRPIFEEWLKPFNDLGANTLTLRNTGGTDHLSFDAVGIPGFQFIQDTIEYDTRTHHSNQDVFDRIQGDDLKQAATIMAAFLYNTAMREDKMPRKTATVASGTP